MDERPYPSEDVFDIVVCDDNVLFKFLDNAVFIFPQDISNNALRQGLLLLDKDKKFVISIIILHSGKIPMQTLKALLRQSDMLMLEDEIDALIADTEYIKIANGTILL